MNVNLSDYRGTEIVYDFVKRFPDHIPPAYALRYWKALHTPAARNGNVPLEFGVSEFSVSLQPDGASTIRWLAETPRRQPFDANMATQARHVGHGLISTLGESSNCDTLHGRFDELFDLMYRVKVSDEPQPYFRIGYALEFSASKQPWLRWYAEPRTAEPQGALARVSAITQSLDLHHHWLLADEGIRRHVPGVSLRGLGFDLSSANVSTLKVYYAVRSCSWSQLRDIAELGGLDQGMAHLERFHQLLLKGRTRLPSNTILLAVILNHAIKPERPMLKWDAFLPQLYANDALVQERIVQLCKEVELDPQAYLDLWEIVFGAGSPQQYANAHQYVSLDLLPGGKAKLNIYLRSPQQVTEHMSHARRPTLLHISKHIDTVRARYQASGVEANSQTPNARHPTLDKAEGVVEGAIQRALINLSDARGDDFSELVHRMSFPREAGFMSGDLCLGDVFQRAVVCKTLAMARSRYDVDEQSLQADLDYLISQQDPASGAWKYFPTLGELPPDADDLAQVLLAFLELGYSGAHTVFSRALVMIDQLIDPESGRAPTWLVLPEASDPESRLYRAAIERWWGDGSDPEVVGNLMFALWSLDQVRFMPWLTRACSWLASTQNEEGWWDSTWYWGRAYGTWMAVRALASVALHEPALKRASDYWIGSQAEGDLHPGTQSPLEAAFSLEIGIELARIGLLPNLELLRRNAHSLCDCQAIDGSWDASPFIRMDIHRAATQRGLVQPKYISYGSRGITTAYCIHALLNYLSVYR
jgi:squalene-hopene/tetraprenyl-beta-curcumene cyclase